MLSGPFSAFNTCEFARKGTESSNSANKLLITDDFMAERVVFEPTVLVKVHTLSKRAP